MTIRGEVDPVVSSRLTQPRHVALLCYLALARPRGLQSRDRLIDLLWPDHDGPRGRQALRNALHGVRHRLGEALIVSVGDQLVGINDALLSCDAWELERGAFDSGPSADDRAAEPLEGLYVGDAPSFEQWLAAERDRLRSLLDRQKGSPAATRGGTLRPPPYLPDAWVLHARGHYLFLRHAHGGARDELLRARDCFERALSLDPTFAPALAGLANFYAVAARRGILAPFEEHFPRAIELSEQALRIDPELAAPHVHFAVKALYLDQDFAGAGVEFATAVSKDASYAEGHRFYGVWLGLAGRHAEALDHMEHAVALEPDVPHFLSSLGAARLAVGDRAGAEEALRATLRYDPAHAAARARLIRLYEKDGSYAAAVDERERPPALPEAAACRAALEAGAPVYEAWMERTLRDEIETLEARVSAGGVETVADVFSPPAARLVELYVRVGDRHRARRWAREARARRPGLAPWLASIPGL